MEFVDVNDRSELLSLPEGYRYLDFLGGEKELRCFVIPYDMPRSQFVDQHGDLLDECLTPIYQNGGIIVRQDASYPLPGFYILSFKKHFPSFDKVDDLTHLRSFLIIRYLRQGMRDVLKIPYIHFHYEEKPAKSCNVHYWLMPVQEQNGNTPIIYDLDIRHYLNQFKFQENKKNIRFYNKKMKEFVESIDLMKIDNFFAKEMGKL